LWKPFCQGMESLESTPLCAKTCPPIRHGFTYIQFIALFTQTGAWRCYSGNGAADVRCTTWMRDCGYGSKRTREKWKPLSNGQTAAPMVRHTFSKKDLSITGNAPHIVRPQTHANSRRGNPVHWVLWPGPLNVSALARSKDDVDRVIEGSRPRQLPAIFPAQVFQTLPTSGGPSCMDIVFQLILW